MDSVRDNRSSIIGVGVGVFAAAALAVLVKTRFGRGTGPVEGSLASRVRELTLLERGLNTLQRCRLDDAMQAWGMRWQARVAQQLPSSAYKWHPQALRSWFRALPVEHPLKQQALRYDALTQIVRQMFTSSPSSSSPARFEDLLEATAQMRGMDWSQFVSWFEFVKARLGTAELRILDRLDSLLACPQLRHSRS